MTAVAFKNARVVRSSWLEEGGRRLDCNPYMSGALEARDALEALSAKKVPLRSLTAGFAGGIYNGPQFSRRWVQDAKLGVQFLSNSDMLNVDLASLPLLNKTYAHSRHLRHLELLKGTTLITCSGTIGRTIYVRPDMQGMWSSQHIMKVVPDTSQIPAGYLYAYLSSRFGVPLLVSGTYGAIIQHIEPEHIAQLPVPRLGSDFEADVADLIDTSARERSVALRALSECLSQLEEEAGFRSAHLTPVSSFATSSVQFSALEERLDAPYHCASALLAESLLERSPLGSALLSSVVNRFFKPPIFKRLWVESEEHGSLFVSGNDIYRFQPEERRYVSRRTPRFESFILKRGWVAFQAAGQIYGLFGRPLFVSGWLQDVFCADDVFRIVPKNEVDGAFLYLFLRTSVGQVLIKRLASGNSIPRVWEPHISRLRVLWPSAAVRERYALKVIEAHDLLESARIAEASAIAKVEARIQRGS